MQFLTHIECIKHICKIKYLHYSCKITAASYSLDIIAFQNCTASGYFGVTEAATTCETEGK